MSIILKLPKPSVVFLMMKPLRRFVLTLLVLACFLFAGAARAEPRAAAKGFHEAVFVVASHEAWHAFFTERAGWELKSKGRVSQGWLEYWNLTGFQADFRLYGNPGSDRGWVRTVRLASPDGGPPAGMIRPNSQSWDLGGIFDINLRVKNMRTVRAELMADGWQGPTDPVAFAFGKFRVKEWLPVGPDGIRLALIERQSPVLTGWPNLRKMSRAFNATMIVPDVSAARRFWEDLGFKAYLEHEGPSPAPGENVLGLPFDAAMRISRKVVILHPGALNDGSIELLSFHDAKGRDFSLQTDLPKRGIYSLRFPVQDVDVLREKAGKFSMDVIAMGRNLPLDPFGRADFIALRAPGGAVVEFFAPRRNPGSLKK